MDGDGEWGKREREGGRREEGDEVFYDYETKLRYSYSMVITKTKVVF